jgi:hypothetical protein
MPGRAVVAGVLFNVAADAARSIKTPMREGKPTTRSCQYRVLSGRP